MATTPDRTAAYTMCEIIVRALAKISYACKWLAWRFFGEVAP